MIAIILCVLDVSKLCGLCDCKFGICPLDLCAYILKYVFSGPWTYKVCAFNIVTYCAYQWRGGGEG